MHNSRYNACIKACNNCVVACNHCASSCLQEQDVKMMVQCISNDMDCAAICALAAAAMSRGSPHAQAICALCADICQACGDECARHDMAHCQACAKACHQCAKACRDMSSAG
ncbi:MAG: four-helix bundle copper-binding protein [Polaromonas sp.]